MVDYTDSPFRPRNGGVNRNIIPMNLHREEEVEAEEENQILPRREVGNNITENTSMDTISYYLLDRNDPRAMDNKFVSGAAKIYRLYAVTEEQAINRMNVTISNSYSDWKTQNRDIIKSISQFKPTMNIYVWLQDIEDRVPEPHRYDIIQNGLHPTANVEFRNNVKYVCNTYVELVEALKTNLSETGAALQYIACFSKYPKIRAELKGDDGLMTLQKKTIDLMSSRVISNHIKQTNLEEFNLQDAEGWFTRNFNTPTPYSPNRNTQSNRPRSHPYKSSNTKCYICGEVGHRRDQCEKKSPYGNRPSPSDRDKKYCTLRSSIGLMCRGKPDIIKYHRSI